MCLWRLTRCQKRPWWNPLCYYLCLSRWFSLNFCPLMVNLMRNKCAGRLLVSSIFWKKILPTNGFAWFVALLDQLDEPTTQDRCNAGWRLIFGCPLIQVKESAHAFSSKKEFILSPIPHKNCPSSMNTTPTPTKDFKRHFNASNQLFIYKKWEPKSNSLFSVCPSIGNSVKVSWYDKFL